MKISVVSPVYGAASLLDELVRQIETTVTKITSDYEIILVEDHSPDNSKQIIRDICATNHKVKGVFMSRNFGQQYALNAGLDLSTGDWVVTLDCDLQDTPAFILNLYEKAQEGYDIVFASRKNRKDGIIKKFGSKLFNRLLSFLTDTIQDETIANFVLYKREAVNALKSMHDFRKYFPLMNHWIGFKTYKLSIPHAERIDGKESSYSLKKRIKLALNTAIAFSTKPLRLIVYLGVCITLLSLFVAAIVAIHYLFSDKTVSGWFTMFVSLWIIAGITIMVMGVIAIYLGSVVEQSKGRPSYIIGERLNFE